MTWTAFLKLVDDFFEAIVNGDRRPSETTYTPPTATIAPTPDNSPTAPQEPPLAQKYDWSTPEEARHSLRVICDEEGLTIAQKNLMSQVVHCESGYLTNATHPNLDAKGQLASTDFGICQWNDWWHWIKKREISPTEAMHNPEKAVRLMCQYVKAGQIKQWVCYSSGLYKKYSA